MTDPQDSVIQPGADLATSGPRRVIQLGETRYTLLGTAHVSAESADDVRALIRSGEYDAVAIELCDSRHQSLANPDALGEQDLFEIFRQGKAGMVAASLALGAFQQRVAEQSGIEPGAEMRAALEESRAADLPLLLIDRRSEEHTSELQSRPHLVCRLLLEKKKKRLYSGVSFLYPPSFFH